MKNMFDFLKNKPIYLLFILIIVLFVPSAIAAKPQSREKLIIISFSIDKIGNEYELSTIAYVPKAAQTFSQNFQIVTAKGNSLNEAVDKISKFTGKEIALAHSNIIMVNNELCDYGLLSSMDYLVREYSLGNNSIVINTGETPAKDVLKQANEISKNLGIAILNIAEFNEKKLLSTQINLEQIYNLSYSPSKCSVLSVFSLDDEEGLEAGQSSSSSSSDQDSTMGQSGSSSSGSSSTSSQKKLLNDGSMTILRMGKRVLDLTPEEAFALGWGMEHREFGIVEIENYNDNIFTNANIKLDVSSSDSKIKTFFEKERPICEISINSLLMINEVNQENVDYLFYNETFHVDSPMLTEAIKNKIGMDFSSILKKLIANNIDLLGIYENFNSNSTKEFKNYLKQFQNIDEYLSKIEFRINISAIAT